ncbi:MAG: hypothetical protein R2710_24670 [Acidimicrobiales bacterium]
MTVEVHFPTLTVDKAPGTGQDVNDVRLDQPFTWTVTITNTDPVASAFNVDATDILPEGWTYDLGSASVVTPARPPLIRRVRPTPGCATMRPR